MRVDEWIIPADAEAVAITIIREGLTHFSDTAMVSTYYGKDQRTVRVMVIGGTTPNLVTDSPRFVFECWDTDEIGAGQLASRVFACLTRSPGDFFAGHWVRGWTPASRPQNYPDPDSRMFRYQITGVLDIRPSIS